MKHDPASVNLPTRIGIQAASLFIGFAYWLFTTRPGATSPLLVATPGDTWRALVGLLGEESTYDTLRITLTEVAWAYALAAGAGLLIGSAAGMSRFLAELVEPVLLSLSAVPIILAYPLCILVFGLGSESKIVFAGLFGFFPITIHTLSGVRNVDAAYLVAGRSMGASGFSLLTKFCLPAARPMITVGMGMSAAMCYLAVVAGQMLSSFDGIGRHPRDSIETYETDVAYTWIAIVVLLPAILRLIAAAVRAITRGRGAPISVDALAMQARVSP